MPRAYYNEQGERIPTTQKVERIFSGYRPRIVGMRPDAYEIYVTDRVPDPDADPAKYPKWIWYLKHSKKVKK